MSIGEQPAYPNTEVAGISEDGEVTYRGWAGSKGMTYRQWLAGMAMQGIISAMDALKDRVTQEAIARESVELADALIAKLSEENPK